MKCTKNVVLAVFALASLVVLMSGTGVAQTDDGPILTRYEDVRFDPSQIVRPQSGDIAVFNSPVDGKLLIKRIVAVGGDFVELRNGRLWVNGMRPAKESDLNLSAGGGPDIRNLSVPDGMVLAIGDHRGRSHDSRYFGLVAERELYGRAVAVYYSRDDGFGWERL